MRPLLNSETIKFYRKIVLLEVCIVTENNYGMTSTQDSSRIVVLCLINMSRAWASIILKGGSPEMSSFGGYAV